MPNVTKFPLTPDQESQLHSTNEKIAKLAAVSPYSDIHSAFVLTAHLAMEALGVPTELEKMPGIEPGQSNFVRMVKCTLKREECLAIIKNSSGRR